MKPIVVMVILSGVKVFTDVRIRILPVKLADHVFDLALLACERTPKYASGPLSRPEEQPGR